MTNYYKLILPIANSDEQENALALLHYHTELESAEQQEDVLIISYQESITPKDSLMQVIQSLEFSWTYRIEDIENINWNEAYEKSYQPIALADNSWGVRASFHPKLETKNEIIIDPKMSFGTGHHETTYQMMTMMTSVDFEHKSVWDYGSGTGLLAILAEKLGATSVLANDNEEWAYLNALENSKINTCHHIAFHHGVIEDLENNHVFNTETKFDIILANITKNILLDSSLKIGMYSMPNTHLLLSGFYSSDIDDIISKYAETGYHLYARSTKNNWACLHLIRNL